MAKKKEPMQMISFTSQITVTNNEGDHPINVFLSSDKKLLTINDVNTGNYIEVELEIGGMVADAIYKIIKEK